MRRASAFAVKSAFTRTGCFFTLIPALWMICTAWIPDCLSSASDASWRPTMASSCSPGYGHRMTGSRPPAYQMVRSSALALTLSIIGGCTKTPEELCRQLDAVEPSNTEADHGRCVRAYTRVKEVDRDAYQALTKCVSILDERPRGECIQKVWFYPKIAADKQKQRAARDDEKRKAVSEFPSLELTKTFEGKVRLPGKEPVAFKIHVPDPFKQHGTETDSTSVPDHLAYGDTYLADDDGFESIEIVISASDDPTVQSVDAAMKATPDAEILKKAQTPTGFILETKSSVSVNLVVTAAVNGSTIKCWTTIDDDIEKDGASKLLPWLEKMCTSIEFR